MVDPLLSRHVVYRHEPVVTHEHESLFLAEAVVEADVVLDFDLGGLLPLVFCVAALADTDNVGRNLRLVVQSDRAHLAGPALVLRDLDQLSVGQLHQVLLLRRRLLWDPDVQQRLLVFSDPCLQLLKSWWLELQVQVFESQLHVFDLTLQATQVLEVIVKVNTALVHDCSHVKDLVRWLVRKV